VRRVITRVKVGQIPLATSTGEPVLERRGTIKARWRTTENNRRAKYYELTRKGRAELEDQTDTWRRLVAAIGQVLETA